MNKPTPGPWKYNENNDQGSTLISGPNNETVVAFKQATYDEEAWWEVSEANARHIVKCVNVHDELMEVLKRVVEYNDTYINGCAKVISKATFNLIVEAIAKAEGKLT